VGVAFEASADPSWARGSGMDIWRQT
jgi:hypothetical protein